MAGKLFQWDRDLPAFAIASLGVLTNGPLAPATPALRKWATHKDASTLRKVGAFVLCALMGGPAGIIGYFVAARHPTTRGDVHDARQAVVNDRYNVDG